MPFYAQSKEQEIVISGQPVQVAAAFNNIGDIKPLYICVTDLYGNALKTKVEIVRYKKNVRGGISFCCAYYCGDSLRDVMLTFYCDSHVWVIES